MTTKESAKRRNVQSKRATSRRSICTNLSLDAHLSLFSRLGLRLHVFFDHFFRQRSGGVPAMTAVLNQNRDGNLGVLRRRVGDKPGMVSVEIGELFGFHVTAFHLDDLRRPGF